MTVEGVSRLCMWSKTVFSSENVETGGIFMMIMGFYVSVSGRDVLVGFHRGLEMNVFSMEEHQQLVKNLTDEQKSVYEKIIRDVNEDKGGFFFLYGFGGTGKTIIWRTLSSAIRSRGDIVLTVASSGIASLLLPGGRTAHSRFVIPLNVTEDSTCNIKQGLKMHPIYTDHLEVKQLFLVVTSEILPVIPKGSRQDIVNASLNSSYLWPHCQLLELTKNMRLQGNEIGTHVDELRVFSNWILAISDGIVGTSVDGNEKVQIPDDLLIKQSVDPTSAIVESTYPNFNSRCNDIGYLQQRAILTPTLDMVESINEYMISLNESSEKSYLSSDTICNSDSTYSALEHVHTPEFLNTIKCSGVPNHALTLKVGIPVMLLRNIDQSTGLCNGTSIVPARCAKNTKKKI
ncbi:PREDICTED: uncharacterized protein LOC109208481 [Nicotiana attenuata]|uniref:uncharacterized protein LOC109208481 n=1 Tax=Nicotiana attenuata TaxID=49451 RepID=UPI00090564A7|nr:PREDICTED: uncharacterized protein LOC109208481 [Nicotiana attenuata]